MTEENNNNDEKKSNVVGETVKNVVDAASDIVDIVKADPLDVVLFGNNLSSVLFSGASAAIGTITDAILS